MERETKKFTKRVLTKRKGFAIFFSIKRDDRAKRSSVRSRELLAGAKQCGWWFTLPLERLH
jgi:hypothetical protein